MQITADWLVPGDFDAWAIGPLIIKTKDASPDVIIHEEVHVSQWNRKKIVYLWHRIMHLVEPALYQQEVLEYEAEAYAAQVLAHESPGAAVFDAAGKLSTKYNLDASFDQALEAIGKYIPGW